MKHSLSHSVSRAVGSFLVVGVAAGAFWLGACSGDSETVIGPAGPPGPAGITGAAGPSGAAGTDGDASVAPSGACTYPCHTFSGVVDQWRLSGHSHPQENEIGGGPCGNCHAIDGIQQRVANNVLVANGATVKNADKGHINYTGTNGAASEVSYAGASTIGRIHCTTCHQFDQTNDPHVTGSYKPGQAPLRVAGGASDTVYIEKSPAGSTTPEGQALSYRAANLCFFCHKSRKDATLYVTASNTISTRWGPHEGPQADIYSGKGGYPLLQTGETYGVSQHTTLQNGCVDCHMQPVAENGNTPDHTMKPKITLCKTCHTTYTGTDFNINGGRGVVRTGLFELEKLLSDANLITRTGAAPYPALTTDELADGQFHLDQARPGTLDAQAAGALYNYFLIARGRDLGVHNPLYTRQLLWDSIRVIRAKYSSGSPQFLPSRPPS
ncbi:hypothetical protein [Labilithrix luteola]|uniref:hypothetical protein n=1 Tax=Labilithrix luteola TaxID=1391654 RepID=UPI0011BAD4DF|nr:hypothetical protein [Labilithrix luteola]